MGKEILYQEILNEEKELENALNAVREYRKHLERTYKVEMLIPSPLKEDKGQKSPGLIPIPNKSKYTIPTEHNKHLKIPLKVLFALKNLANITGTKTDVANKMLEIEPNYDGGFDKAKGDAGFWLSKIAGEKDPIIKVVKQGIGKSPSIYAFGTE